METSGHFVESIFDTVHQNEKETPLNAHTCQTDTYTILVDSIIMGTDERYISKNSHLVKIRDFKEDTLTDLKH